MGAHRRTAKLTDKVIAVLVTEDEHRTVKEAAAAQRKTIAEFGRTVLLAAAGGSE